MMLLVQAVRNGNPDLCANHAEEEMIHFLKPHQVKAYVKRITRGVKVCLKKSIHGVEVCFKEIYA